MKAKIPSLKPRIQNFSITRASSPTVERERGWKLVKTRERIGYRDEYTCQICGKLDIKGEVDHKTPLHLGGAESDENRQWLCLECHDAKTEREERTRGGSNLPGS